MAKVFGLELRAVRTVKTDDKYTVLQGSLYLGSTKIASVQTEKKGSDSAAQLFMMYGCSEAALRSHIEAGDMTVETMIDQFQWLQEMEQQYSSHAATACGVACLHHQNGNVTMGIPTRLGAAPEEQVLTELQHFIEKNEREYGTCLGYAIFRRPEDFELGTPITLEALQA